MLSSFLRSLEERKPLSVEEAVPYALLALTPVPVLVETVLELRALRTLLDLLIADGRTGIGSPERVEEVDMA
jgi:hypothetical protein